MLARLEAAARTIARALAATGLMILIAYAAMTLIDGLSRTFLDTPIEGVRDLGEVIVAVSMACCFPMAFLARSNIAVKFAEVFLSRRVADSLDTFSAALVAAALIPIAWRVFVYAGQEARAGEATVMLEIPVAPFWYVVAGAIACTAIVQILIVLLDVVRLRRLAGRHGP